MRTTHLRAAAACALALTAVPASAHAADGNAAAKLRNAITVDGMLRHERALQQIANLNGGNRAAGTPGYDASVGYVVETLKRAGYTPKVLPFEFPYFAETAPSVLERTAPDPKTYVNGTDFATMQYSGTGDVTKPVTVVDANFDQPGGASTAGCEEADFAGFPAGNVALVQRGTCTFGAKVQNATAAGASAVIIFNQGNSEDRTGVVEGTLGGPATIPVLGTSYAIGQELAAPGTAVHVAATTVNETRTAANVVAQTAGGDPDDVEVVGSHLDSVPAGPGINDNGSGSAFNLELAIQMAKQKIKPRNAVRFAFWGAEEEGLLGSTDYVANLSPSEIAKIALNLNFDMIASPNFVRFVYDGDGGGDPDAAGPPGSAAIELAFNSYFAQRDLAYEPTAFDGRSDYGPFIEAGIPAGGLFSGAEGIKTADEAQRFGGTAGQPYDACYHQACDTIANLTTQSFGELADAAATVAATYAFAGSRPADGVTASKRRTGVAKARRNIRALDFRGPHARR
jgi:Zn-dependent M28 family amino/carboxypeptidase